MSDTKTTSSLRKKRLLVLVSVIVAFVVLILLNTIDFSKTPEVSTNAPYTPDTLPDFRFEVDPTIDYAKDEFYLNQDLTPQYTVSGLTDDLAMASDKPYTDFFIKYFDALGKGDHKALNALCSDVYFRSNKALTKLSKQLLYDVSVTRLETQDVIDTADSEKDRVYLGWKLTYFEVNYRIYQNDGSFRRDIADDMAIVQIFTVLTDENERDPKLNSISYYRESTPGTSPETPSVLPLVLPLAWLLVSVIGVVLAFVLKKIWAISLPIAAFAAFLTSIKARILAQSLVFILVFAAAYLLLFFLKKKKARKKVCDGDTPRDE